MSLFLRWLKSSIKGFFGFFGVSIHRHKVSKYRAQQMLPLKPDHFFDLYFSLIDPENFFFVQIGANDGKTNDLLYSYIDKYNLRGIIVEPQVDVFEKLKMSHKIHSRLAFANVAIAGKTQKMTFYTVKKELIDDSNYFQATAISSFNKRVFEETLKRRIGGFIKNISANLDDYTEKKVIEALSFEDFVSQYKIQKIDFLFLDCEGYDFEILKTIDFTAYKPKVINFESKFMSDVDREACESMLISHGYKLFRYHNDTCAFQ